MMQPLAFDTFLTLSHQSNYVAVFEEMAISHLTPPMIHALVGQAIGQEGALFEDRSQASGRYYSYFCFDELAQLRINDNERQQPLAAIRAFRSDYASATRKDAALLLSHSMGYVTYDSIRCFEAIPDRHGTDEASSGIVLTVYTLALTYDHLENSLLISVLVKSKGDLQKGFQQAKQKILDLKNLLSSATIPSVMTIDRDMPVFQADSSDADFMQTVDAAKKHIISGDVFQVVLSRSFKCRYTASPQDIYRALQRVSPAPFMFYLVDKNRVIIGASPERLVSVQNGELCVNPIAGTRRRIDQQLDESIAADLLQDKKEVAEHMMLVDLARNDVSMVSESGSVRVRDLLQVKHYSHLSHMTSTVTGLIQKKHDALDALIASFPAGTVSGAPKIRAMQIIDELESSRRGLYGGAIFRFDLLGNLDSSLAIRMAVLENGDALIRAGAGIVYDSDPATEARETRIKAQSMMDAIITAHGVQPCY